MTTLVTIKKLFAIVLFSLVALPLAGSLGCNADDGMYEDDTVEDRIGDAGIDVDE